MIDEKEFKHFPKFTFSLLPTPLQKLENISRELGINLYCKRDDLTSFAFGGNKTRKLDYLIADAKNKGCDTLIASGAVQSNFCRLAAAAGKSVNMKVHLVLGGDESNESKGNLLIGNLFDPEILFIKSPDWNEWELFADNLQKELEHSGKMVYRLPIGGSTPVGALGYVDAFKEIMDDCRRMGISIRKIIHATSSGGTQAGLITGKELMNWSGKIIGIGVAKTDSILTDEVFSLAGRTGKLLDLKIEKKNVLIDSSFMGDAYGVKTAESTEAINYFAQLEGIMLDNVYSGKAAAAVIEYARKGIFEPGENILFLHTGGNIELFS
ncbi:MAG: D-cysteine desulfhydrase family protein [Ignavibacteriales bacterium]|nr:D-cysteine desulfhydrase family protein [Ignavibacteriales bacterium]